MDVVQCYEPIVSKASPAFLPLIQLAGNLAQIEDSPRQLPVIRHLFTYNDLYIAST